MSKSMYNGTSAIYLMDSNKSYMFVFLQTYIHCPKKFNLRLQLLKRNIIRFLAGSLKDEPQDLVEVTTAFET